MEPRQEDQARLAGSATVTGLADANLGAADVRDGFEFDVAALTRWMAQHVEHFSGPITVQQFNGGQSNPTYKLTTPTKKYVLRRKPPGRLLQSAHAVDREVRVLRGLAVADFPVPHVHGLCMDESIIGTWFYVMEMVEGRIFWDATLPGAMRDERAAIFNAMNAAIAQLHQVNFAAVGLGDYGRPGNYFARQIARWSRQYLDDQAAGRDRNMDALTEWLMANIPADESTAIVHGDLRIDNIIFHPSAPEILAVLDWELSTLGHPLADFGYNTMMYRLPPHIIAGLAGANLEVLGIPSERDYLRDYCARTGRPGIDQYGFYLAFNFFRLAAIFHGIRGRVLRGNASSARAKERASAFPELAHLGLEATCGL